MAKVYVDNRNPDHSRLCEAADGENAQIGPGAKNAPMDEKFLWKMHPDVIRSRGSVRVFKTADQEAAENPQEASFEVSPTP